MFHLIFPHFCMVMDTTFRTGFYLPDAVTVGARREKAC